MTDTIWKPSQRKYGVAICNYSSETDGALGLHVGETVHILEEYGSGSTGWFRGSSLKNKDKIGIFPACLIHIKKCQVDNEGQYESITPVEDMMVKEVAYVLREWSTIWKDLYTKTSPLFDSITGSMLELITLRGLLVDRKLTCEDSRDIKNDIVGVIDWGNGQLGMDLVPRIDGEQVDADMCSITCLHRVHMDSAQISCATKPRQRRKTKSSKGEMAIDSGISTHHLLTSFKNFGCNVGDTSETLLSLFQFKDNKCICLTEKFLAVHTSTSVPEDIDKLGNYYGLFTDLTSDELEKEMFLVAQIYRLGRMKDENSKKSKTLTYRRPWGVGVTSLNLAKLPSNFKEWEFNIRITTCENSESDFPCLHEQLIRRHNSSGGNTPASNNNKLGLCLTVSLRTLHGDLAMVKKEDPMLFSRGVALVQKLGFSDIITPGEVRNDLYVTLKSAELSRGKKKSQKNVEVRVKVFDQKGQQIENCITYGCGEPAQTEYNTAVFYHNNRPEWNEAIRISIPIDTFPGSHIFFELFHCSVSQKDHRKPSGFAFVRITNEAHIVIKDDTHELCLYKLDEKEKDKDKLDLKRYLELPFLMDDLNDPSLVSRIPKHLQFKANERESLSISTLLCSGKFTQNGDLLGILNWRGEQFQGKLDENLQKLTRMQGEEIVKFLHDILDALFDMFSEESDTKQHSHKIFMAMVNIFTLIHHARFETFKPVLNVYISDTFSAPLVHKALCVCFGEMVQTACQPEGKTNLQLIKVFQAGDYIFRFIVQSRKLQMKHVYGEASGENEKFQTNLRELFQSLAQLLSSNADNLKALQVALLGSLHMCYSPLLEVMTEKEVAMLLAICIRDMPDAESVEEDITRYKLDLLRKTVVTKIFTNDEARNVLLPICIEQIKYGLQHKILIKHTIDLTADVMDVVFKLKQRVVIKEDIQLIVSSLFDIVTETVLSLGNSPGSAKEHIPRVRLAKTRNKVRRSHTHSVFPTTSKVVPKRKNSTIQGPKRRSSNATSVAYIPEITIETTDDDVIINDDVIVEEKGTSHESRDRQRKISAPNMELKTDHHDTSERTSTTDKFKQFLGFDHSPRSRSKSIGSENTDFSNSNSDDNILSEIPREANLSSDEEITNKSPRYGAMIACLTEMLRLMDDEHYDALLHVYHRGQMLKTFLVNVLTVFKLLVQPEVFPKDWTVMRMVTNNVVFTAVEYFSQALKDNYIVGDKFDPQLWRSYFNLAVAFITQPSLQLNRYSKAKAQKLKERYQDMRVLMGIQVETLWTSLKHHKETFIPSMIGPFLELTLVPEKEVRKATLPIIFDMIESDQRVNGNFKQVEAALIERIDYFLTVQFCGDDEYKDLFRTILLERVQSEPNLQENGSQFIISVTHLLERLLDYRQVVDGDENRDKRMHCTFNILNFYKNEINREEMYIRYVNKLHELHMAATNHAEAGLTLQLYAKVLNWSETVIPSEMRYRQERECDRKEMLYTQIINCFDKGKVWEYALPLCKDLAEYYERKLDYKKLGDILKQQASFYQKILEGVPGEDPAQPDMFFPRQDPSYYKVAYYGQSFPAFVRNKQFIYRGDECLKLSTIINHLTAEFPTAQIISNAPQNESIKDGEQQYIQICSVKAVPASKPEFRNKDVPLEIRRFYDVNEVDTFQFDRPYHRGEKDKNNEYKTLCIERTKVKTTYKFPGILRWYEVVGIEVEMLCPIQYALESISKYNTEFEVLVKRCQSNPKLYFQQMEMMLQGMINAAVNGGISKYYEAFFTLEFEQNHSDEVMYLHELKTLINDQVQKLSHGMQLHEKLVTPDLMPLHKSLEKELKKMRREVQDHSSPHSSMVSVKSYGSSVSEPGRPGTPGSTSIGSSGSGRSSYSQDEEHPGVIQSEELVYTPLPTGRYRESRVPCPGTEVRPPPIPCRPQSMLLSGQHMSQVTNQLYNSQSRTGSDPSLTGSRSPASSLSQSQSVSNIPRGTNSGPVRRSLTVSQSRPPDLPTRPRKGSVPNIPTYERSSPINESSIMEEGEGPPSLPQKSGIKKTRTSIMLNGSTSEVIQAFSPTSPQDIDRSSPNLAASSSPRTSPSNNSNVPPLPPRKQSFNSQQSQQHVHSNQSNQSPSLGRNLSESDAQSSVSIQSNQPTRNSSVHTPVRYTRVPSEANSLSSTQPHSKGAPPPIPRRTDPKPATPTSKHTNSSDDHSTNL